jgi:hypothetical protein
MQKIKSVKKRTKRLFFLHTHKALLSILLIFNTFKKVKL